MKTIKQSAGMGYEAPDICLVGHRADSILCASVDGGILDSVTVEDYGEL
ncbi:MAG: hypothetical protein MJY49_06155 [Bacteroidales bacterium]|nr:hypothetical protein [Bacteroidales bacterium]